jgi:hypothetical protein
MLPGMGTAEQRQFPRIGLGVPVILQLLGRGTVDAELQDISCGGCFFKSPQAVALDRRISVVLSAAGGKSCQVSGRVVRTVAYKGFAVLFDLDDGGAIEEFIRDLTPLPQESRAELLSAVLKPEIQIY